jgi:hypothetical protein
MANVQAGFGGYGGDTTGSGYLYPQGKVGGGSPAVSNSSKSFSNQQSSGGSYFHNNPLIDLLSGGTGNTIQQANQNYMGFVQNPTQHPIFQNALGGLLQALIPSEQLGARNLNDMFRGAGNTSSSTFADAARNFQSDLVRNRQTVASNLLTALFPQVAQSLYAPIAQTSPLIDALKMSQQQSTGNSESTSGPGATQEKNNFGVMSMSR